MQWNCSIHFRYRIASVPCSTISHSWLILISQLPVLARYISYIIVCTAIIFILHQTNALAVEWSLAALYLQFLHSAHRHGTRSFKVMKLMTSDEWWWAGWNLRLSGWRLIEAHDLQITIVILNIIWFVGIFSSWIKYWLNVFIIFFILLLLLLKEVGNAKAGREQLTPYQSEDPNPTTP